MRLEIISTDNVLDLRYGLNTSCEEDDIDPPSPYDLLRQYEYRQSRWISGGLIQYSKLVKWVSMK